MRSPTDSRSNHSASNHCTSNHDEQWLDRVGRRIKASFPSLTVYNAFNGIVTIDRYVLVHSLRKDGVRVRKAEIYFEGWSPFSDTEFNRVVLQYDAQGNPKRFYTDGIDVPYYGDLPFQDTQGYVTLLN